MLLKVSEIFGCLLYFCKVILGFQRESVYTNSRKRGVNPAVTCKEKSHLFPWGFCHGKAAASRCINAHKCQFQYVICLSAENSFILSCPIQWGCKSLKKRFGGKKNAFDLLCLILAPYLCHSLGSCGMLQNKAAEFVDLCPPVEQQCTS